jgi:hypothetical protein
MSVTTEKSSATTAVRPFTVPVASAAELEALRARVAATRWPDQELVKDHSQGPKLAVIDPLTNPTGHGGSAADAFDVMIPSMLYRFCPDTGHN